jgi:LPXTG-motif cell wall-anchored protein
MDIVTWIVVVGVVVLGGGGGYLFFRRRRGPVKEEYEHFNCPHCKQRLRYYPRQAGRAGECPRCHKPITFPGSPTSPGRRRP